MWALSLLWLLILPVKIKGKKKVAVAAVKNVETVEIRLLVT